MDARRQASATVLDSRIPSVWLGIPVEPHDGLLATVWMTRRLTSMCSLYLVVITTSSTSREKFDWTFCRHDSSWCIAKVTSATSSVRREDFFMEALRSRLWALAYCSTHTYCSSKCSTRVVIFSVEFEIRKHISQRLYFRDCDFQYSTHSTNWSTWISTTWARKYQSFPITYCPKSNAFEAYSKSWTNLCDCAIFSWDLAITNDGAGKYAVSFNGILWGTVLVYLWSWCICGVLHLCRFLLPPSHVGECYKRPDPNPTLTFCVGVGIHRCAESKNVQN